MNHLVRALPTIACAAAVLAGFNFSGALASDETITVTGTRLEAPVSEIGSSISVITQSDIEEMGFDFVVDALAAAPGVSVNQNGAFGGQAAVRIRGSATEQSLVLIDGVVVNDPTAPGGGFDFAQLDTDLVDRIEILKGPHSTLWGTDAIGGVVSIVTKKPEDGLNASGFIEGGSFNTFRGGAALSGSDSKGDFRLSVSGLTTDGISKADEDRGNPEEDGMQSLTYSGRGGLNLGDARLELALLYAHWEADFDSSVFDLDFFAFLPADGPETAEVSSFAGNTTLRLPLWNERLQNMFVLGYSEIERENFFAGASTFRAEGERLTYRYQGTLDVADGHRAAFGAEREESTADGEEIYINGYFGLYEFKPVGGVTLTGGVRLDDHENFGQEVTGRVAAAWQATDNLILRASWGQGFKAPTIFQSTYFFCSALTLCGTLGPNSNLKPETSEAYDFGADILFGGDRGSIGITYFNQDTEDLIDFIYDGLTTASFYDNIAVAQSEGVELSIGFQFTDWLSAFADYAFVDAVDGTGTTLARVPNHTADFRVAIDPEGPVSGAILVRHNGNERGSFAPDAPAWTRVDLNAAYQFNERIELYGRVENLFDESYQQIFGYGTPGLSGYFGLRLKT